jgi:O-antigen/teichoic acid export membrane protein
MNINNNTYKRLPLKVNFSWNFLGNIVFSFGQWAVLAILTKLVVVEEVGNYSYAVAFTAPFVLFFQMQMRSLQITDTNDEYTFNDYLGFRIISSLISLIFIVFISLMFGNDMRLTILIASVTLFKLSDSMSDIFYGLFQKHEYMKHIAISMIIKATITVLFFFITLRLTHNIILSVLFVTFLKTIIIIIYDLHKASNYIKIYPLFDNNVLIRLLKASFPLGLMSLLMSLDSNIPKYVIEHFEGVESLGYFSVLSYINMAGGQMITSISQASTPRLAILYTYENKKMFIRMLLKLTMIGFAIGVFSLLFVLLFGEEFISILYSKEYTKHMNVFIVIMIAGAINYTASFLGNGMTAARAFNIQPVLGIIWVLTSLIVSLVMVPKFGLLGGAIALVFSATVKLVSKGIVIYLLMRK